MVKDILDAQAEGVGCKVAHPYLIDPTAEVATKSDNRTVRLEWLDVLLIRFS